LFYTQNPKLLVEEKDYPHDLIRKIRRQAYLVEKEADDKRKKEIEEAVAREKENERVEKRQVRKKVSKEVEANGKIGVPASLERLKVKKKIKKIKIKTKSQMVIDLVEDDDDLLI
jgi:hypothetical protein